jgi:hypothetical protein
VARRLCRSGKSDKQLRCSGKSGNKAAVRQWQEWQGEVARVTRPLRGSGKSGRKIVARVARVTRPRSGGGKSGNKAAARQWGGKCAAFYFMG